jgi:acetyl esterase/lipase
MTFIPLDASKSEGENTEQWSFNGAEWWLRNTNRPSVSVYPATNDSPTGAAALVIPGGGFQFVSMSNEGWPIAQRLAAQGITAVVLKYRTAPTPRSDDDFFEFMGRLFSGRIDPESLRAQRARAVSEAKADAQLALAWINENAAQYAIDSSRVGILGFSAGAMTAMAVVLDPDGGDPPAFLGAIYGDLGSVAPPKDPMPLFVAIASDDPLLGHQSFGLIEDWHGAGGSTELHWYQGGGHGFGSFSKGTTSDRWFDQFTAWLIAEGFTTQAM